MPGEEAVMYTDYIPCQERKRSCIHLYGLHTMPGEGSGHVYVYTDYIPCQEKEAVMYTCIRITYHARRRKRSCIHVYGLHTMPGEEAVMYTCIRSTYHARRGSGHVYMYTDYRYRY